MGLGWSQARQSRQHRPCLPNRSRRCRCDSAFRKCSRGINWRCPSRGHFYGYYRGRNDNGAGNLGQQWQSRSSSRAWPNRRRLRRRANDRAYIWRLHSRNHRQLHVTVTDRSRYLGCRGRSSDNGTGTEISILKETRWARSGALLISAYLYHNTPPTIDLSNLTNSMR